MFGRRLVNCCIRAVLRSKSDVACKRDNITVCVCSLENGSTTFTLSLSTEETSLYGRNNGLKWYLSESSL